MAFIDSPRTDATFGESGIAIGDMSIEMSFHSPKKRHNDLVSQMRNAGRTNLKTPKSRNILAERGLSVQNRRSGEFTPLLKSHTKRAITYGKENAFLPRTPAFLKATHGTKDTPELRPPESSAVFQSDTDSDIGTHTEQHSLPVVAGSSVQSTPLATLPQANGDRMLDDQRNLMTLREQENIINKTEKENFGLKLKIHFLEDLLNKADPNLNQNALKENTDLRVDRATLQRDLAKVKKQLASSARDAEKLKQQLLESKARSEEGKELERVQEELHTLQAGLQRKEDVIRRLQDAAAATDKDQEIEKLKETIDDLEAELREKERLIEAEQGKDDARISYAKRIEELEAGLRDASIQTERLADLNKTVSALEEKLHIAEGELEETKDSRVQLVHERDDALSKLEEVGDELAATCSSLHKLKIELESRTKTIQQNQTRTGESHEALQTSLEDKSQEIASLNRALKVSTDEASARESDLLNQVCLLRQRNEESLKARTAVEQKFNNTLAQLESKSDEKTLLQTRHDALTHESESLQRELADSRSQITRQQDEIKQERQHAAENERILRNESNDDKANISAEIARLQTLLDSERDYFKSQRESWDARSKEMRSQKLELERRLDRLKRDVEKAQSDSRGQATQYSDLQKAMDNGKEHLEREKEQLTRRINLLEAELADKERELDEIRPKLSKSKKGLAGTANEQDAAQERLQALEDEVEILQSALEEKSEQMEEVAKYRQEAEDQRLQLLSFKQEAAISDANRGTADIELRYLKESLRTEQGRRNQLSLQLSEMKTQLRHVKKTQLQPERSDRKVVDQLELTRSQLEQKISDLEVKCTKHRENDRESETNVRKLKARIHSLEKDLRNFQISKATDRPTSSERKDLHEMVKSAKLEAEDLQWKLRDYEARTSSGLKREQGLRSQLQQLRLERDEHQHKSAILVEELEALQGRYEDKLDEVISQQRHFEEERRQLCKQASAVNPPSSRVHAAGHAPDQKHAVDLKDLARQIGYLKARYRREQNFRGALAYEKGFLLMQIEMFKACNTADLRLLEEMGVNPQRGVQKKTPSIRAVAYMVMATFKMRRMQYDWIMQSKFKGLKDDGLDAVPSKVNKMLGIRIPR